MSRAVQTAEAFWTINQSINVDRLSMDELKLIFNQAEKHLDDTVKQGESIASKTMSMITLMAGLLVGLSGYTISIWKGPASLNNKDIVAIFGCLYILGLLIYVINNIMTYYYWVAGSPPEELVNSTYTDDDIQEVKCSCYCILMRSKNITCVSPIIQNSTTGAGAAIVSRCAYSCSFRLFSPCYMR